MIGKTISHYKILEKLGEGGMGVVYKAQDTKLDRYVALKFLPLHLGQAEEENKRFIHEAKAASALEHNNICNIHEIGETEDGQLFIAMAFYEGDSLKEKIERGPMPLDEAIETAIQIAQGLAKAHAKGIVHRDIKPANVMITNENVVKVLDFGLAKLIGRTQLTKEGTTLGTVAYMSPEQAQGGVVDHRTDIWSLGAVFYEMITGRQPFQGDYEQAIMYGIMNEDAEPITGRRTGVPMELERIVNKALSKRPDERYHHVDELAVDLLRTSESVLKTKAATGPIKKGWSRLRSKTLIMMASTLAVFTALVAFFVLGKFGSSDKKLSTKPIMLAVLPFENLGDPEDAYFADGITDEIVTKLSTIPELGVIARESSFKYQGNEHSIKEIGEQLGVSYILKGAIRWQRTSEGASRVRVTPKLVSVADNRNIWAAAYEENLEQIFAVQANVAEQVSAALNITLIKSKKRALEKKPTENLEAYNYFLRGKEIHNSARAWKESLPMAEELFNNAVSLDSSFALAHAWLSVNHSLSYHYFIDRSKDRVKKAKTSFEKALSLDPNLPEAFVAQGRYFYYGFRDYQEALKSLEMAKKLKPNDWFTIYTMGVIKKRQGLFDEAVSLYLKAQALNPTNYRPPSELGIVYGFTRKYKEAEKNFRHVISLWPEKLLAYTGLVRLLYAWDGNTAKARQVLETASSRFDPETVNDLWRWFYTLEGNFEKALECITFSSLDNPQRHPASGSSDSLHYYFWKAD